MYNIYISFWITFVLKTTTLSCFSFEYINACLMFHAVKYDPIPFSVLSLADCCSFYHRVRARSVIATISHINLFMKTAIVCSYFQRNWQYKTKKNKTKTKHNMCWTPLWAIKHKQCNKTWDLLQTTGGKDEPNMFFMWTS
jgi:hypothetical protein